MSGHKMRVITDKKDIRSQVQIHAVWALCMIVLGILSLTGCGNDLPPKMNITVTEGGPVSAGTANKFVYSNTMTVNEVAKAEATRPEDKRIITLDAKEWQEHYFATANERQTEWAAFQGLKGIRNDGYTPKIDLGRGLGFNIKDSEHRSLGDTIVQLLTSQDERGLERYILSYLYLDALMKTVENDPVVGLELSGKYDTHLSKILFIHSILKDLVPKSQGASLFNVSYDSIIQEIWTRNSVPMDEDAEQRQRKERDLNLKLKPITNSPKR